MSWLNRPLSLLQSLNRIMNDGEHLDSTIITVD